MRKVAKRLFLASLAILGLGREGEAAAKGGPLTIPAGDAKARLAAWSEQSGIKLDVADDLLTGVRTNAVSGQEDAQLALDAMIAGTQLQILSDTGDVIALGKVEDWDFGFDSDVHREEDDLIGGYAQNVRRVFAKLYAPTVIARLTAVPSFSREWAVGLKRDGAAYSVIYLQTPVQVWRYSLIDMYTHGQVRIVDGPADQLDKDLADLRKGLPDTPADIRPKLCEARLDASLGQRLAKGWEAVMRIKQRRVLGLDGETFEFAFRDGQDELRRDIWSPDQESVEGRLVDVAAAMTGFCEQPILKKKALSERLGLLEAALAGRGEAEP